MYNHVDSFKTKVYNIIYHINLPYKVKGHAL